MDDNIVLLKKIEKEHDRYSKLCNDYEKIMIKKKKYHEILKEHNLT